MWDRVKHSSQTAVDKNVHRKDEDATLLNVEFLSMKNDCDLNKVSTFIWEELGMQKLTFFFDYHQS